MFITNYGQRHIRKVLDFFKYWNKEYISRSRESFNVDVSFFTRAAPLNLEISNINIYV